ncbi:putative reverse transcriptase domain-containing protein [Tanacetum coccineum]
MLNLSQRLRIVRHLLNEELKEQLQEMLRKAFIDSVSLWGARSLFVKKNMGAFALLRSSNAKFFEVLVLVQSCKSSFLGHIVAADGHHYGSIKDERQESFEELKRRLVSAPILTLPSGSGGFQIYSDASKKGLGLCLDATWVGSPTLQVNLTP